MSMISEFVEEIKAKINRKKEYHKNFYEKLGQNSNDNDLHKATQLAFDDCMEIINKLAEKYRDVPDTNAGKWILCSDRLPEDVEDVLVWFEYFRYGSYNRLFQTIGISYTYDGKWSGFVNGQSGWHQLSIIAWQPLPEPYKGE